MSCIASTAVAGSGASTFAVNAGGVNVTAACS